MKKLFVPVLKTKRASEKNALKKLIPAFDARDDIIPYLEIIKSFSDKDVETYKKYLGTRPYFAETLIEQDVASLFSVPSITPVWNVKRQGLVELSSFIKIARDSQRSIGVRIPDGDAKSWEISKALLGKGDYLFVDIDTNKYDSSFFLRRIKSFERPFQIIVLSNERSTPLTGKELLRHDLNKLPDSTVNTSVIGAIKRGEFPFEGFASYCSAKNDLTEEVKKIARTVNGYMLVYSYAENAFSVIVSDTNAHIAVSYRELLPKILNNMANYIDPHFLNTPISKGLINDCAVENTFSCPKAITIMIVHYIEEIMNGLNVDAIN